MDKEKAEALLAMLGKRLREGEDALAMYSQMSSLPESNTSRKAFVKAAEIQVDVWVAEVAEEVDQILNA